MKTRLVLAFALLALVSIAAAPVPAPLPDRAPAETAPEPALPDLVPADAAEIGMPAPLFLLPPCIQACIDAREECDAGCSDTLCHRECRDSAVACANQC